MSLLATASQAIHGYHTYAFHILSDGLGILSETPVCQEHGEGLALACPRSIPDIPNAARCQKEGKIRLAFFPTLWQPAMSFLIASEPACSRPAYRSTAYCSQTTVAHWALLVLLLVPIPRSGTAQSQHPLVVGRCQMSLDTTPLRHLRRSGCHRAPGFRGRQLQPQANHRWLVGVQWTVLRQLIRTGDSPWSR